VVGSCKCSDEPLDCGATELVMSFIFISHMYRCLEISIIHSVFFLISTVFYCNFW
jgi:hypothetical protein